MIQLPYKALISAVVAIGVLFGWYATWQSLRVAKANLEAAAEREVRWQETVAECQMNRQAFEERFDEIVSSVNAVAAQRERLQGAVDNAGLRAREIAEARDALARLRAEHDALVDRAVPLTACQTYEMVLVALSGGIR